MDPIRGFEIDWENASFKASRYSKSHIDWWQIKETKNDQTFMLIGEDSDGDGAVDFIHADTKGTGRIDFSAFLKEGELVITNLIEAWLEMNFSLPWARSQYIPHDIDVYFNEVKIVSFKDTIPEGHYSFPIPPRAVLCLDTNSRENKIEIKSEHLRGGHYIVTCDFQILYRLTNVETFVIAESREAAEKKVLETPGFRFKGADLSVNSNDISISKSDGIAPGESLEVRANIYNLGMDPGKDAAVALVMSLPGGINPVEVARITLSEVPLYGPTPVKFPWIAVPGEHALRVVIDPDKKLEENSRFNNEALITVKVPGKDTPPELEIRSPDQGQKFNKPKVQLDASGIDESGISLMEYRIDGGLWTQRQGSDRLSEEVTIQPGDHTIFFRATDVSGNQTTESRTISVTFDKPVLILLEPAEGAIIDQNIVTAKIELGDPAKIACVEARTGGGAWRDIPIADEKASSFKIPAEFGRQSLEVKAVDMNGVEASISRSINVTSQADEPIQQMPQKSPEQVPEGTPREENPGGILFEGLNWTVVDDPSPSEPSKWVVKDDKLQQLSNIFRTDREYEFWQGTHIFAGSDSSTDCELSFDISSSDDDGIGAIVRYQDRNNYYRFILVQDSANRGPFRRLEKFEKGQSTLLAEDKNGYTPGQIYHFEFKAIGDALEVWMDGIKILSARDSSFGSGKAGFVAYASPGLSIWNIKINDSV